MIVAEINNVQSEGKTHELNICGTAISKTNKSVGHNVLLHPGGGKEWRCPHCDTNHNTPQMFTLHLRVKHQISESMLTFLCSKCNDFARPKSGGVATHMWYCKGPTESGEHQCEDCERSFDTYPGKQVHRSRLHRSEYNSDLKEKKSFPYMDAELIFIVNKSNLLREMGCAESTINARIVRDFLPTRTTEAIRKIRGSQRYLDMEALVDMCKSEHDTSGTESTEEEVNVQTGLESGSGDSDLGRTHAKERLTRIIAELDCVDENC